MQANYPASTCPPLAHTTQEATFLISLPHAYLPSPHGQALIGDLQSQPNHQAYTLPSLNDTIAGHSPGSPFVLGLQPLEPWTPDPGAFPHSPEERPVSETCEQNTLCFLASIPCLPCGRT